MAESRTPTSPPAPISPIHNVTLFRASLLLSPRRMAESDIPVRPMEVAAMEPEYIFIEPGAQNIPSLLTFTRPGCGIQGLTIHKTCSRTWLLPGSSLSMKRYKGLTSKVFVLISTVALEAPLSLIRAVCFKNRLPFLVITLVCKTSLEFALCMTSPAGYLPRTLQVPTLHS